MVQIRSGFWALFGLLSAASYGATATAQCVEDSDCDPLSSCLEETYTEDCSWVEEMCAGDSECLADMNWCEPYSETYAYCQRRGCESDADCDGGFCEHYGWSECSGGIGMVCDEYGDCYEDYTEEDCVEVDASQCRYTYERDSCEADSECGEGFTCQTDTYTYCSGPAWPGGGSELVNEEGWVGGDPESPDDDPAGIQGAWYSFGDNIACAPPEGNPCSANGCCLSYTTIVDPDYEAWGCGIGLALNSTGGDAMVREPYAGSASLFRLTIDGEVPPGTRVEFPQEADGSSIAPFVELGGPGSYAIDIHEAECPSWADGNCVDADPASTYDIRFVVPGGDEENSGTICVSSLEVVGAPEYDPPIEVSIGAAGATSTEPTDVPPMPVTPPPSGAGGTMGGPVPVSPTPGAPPADGECWEETYSYCQLIEVPCATDSDCPSSMACAPNWEAECYESNDGAVVCLNTEVPESLCQPLAWGPFELESEDEFFYWRGQYDEETGCLVYGYGERDCPDGYYYEDGTYYSYEDGLYHEADGTVISDPWGPGPVGPGGYPTTPGATGGTGTTPPTTGSGGSTGTSVDPAAGADDDSTTDSGAAPDPEPEEDEDATPSSSDSDGSQSGGLDDGFGLGLGLGGCSVSSSGTAPRGDLGLVLAGLAGVAFVSRRRRRG